jgi:formylglycine-generating enzyme required for sulfatase activity
VQDWKGEYASGVVKNPTGPSGGDSRVLRGGSWALDGGFLRSANRYAFAPGYRSANFGLRPARGQAKGK